MWVKKTRILKWQNITRPSKQCEFCNYLLDKSFISQGYPGGSIADWSSEWSWIVSFLINDYFLVLVYLVLIYLALYPRMFRSWLETKNSLPSRAIFGQESHILKIWSISANGLFVSLCLQVFWPLERCAHIYRLRFIIFSLCHASRPRYYVW